MENGSQVWCLKLENEQMKTVEIILRDETS